ncbi:MAG TPA: class I SAM-dependent methyltransferase [Acetobacteraceae bacterium]|jgi:SAM-dependent methyltransferase|nr:class I SAM-dependent methyltransferase [Acetobacteraceae bacterium]
MTQNIYDNAAFFAGYSQLGRSLEGLDGAAEWPSLQAMLPPMPGLRVADLGCGFGWFCRWARGAGAASVLGLDVSENMLARARGFGDDPGISYARADLEDLRLPETEYNLIYSSLTFHYIVAFGGLLARIQQALAPRGKLVFSIEHPIYMAPSQPRFTLDAEGRRVWPIDRYLEEGPRQTDWLAKGVIKQHRTIGTTLNLLLAAGFTLDHVEEWSPTDAQIAARPALAHERDRPMFLLVAAHK